MPGWILENIGTILICIVLGVVIIGIITAMVKNRKKGKSSCCGNCGHCPMDGSCHTH